jgi:glutamine synthetase
MVMPSAVRAQGQLAEAVTATQAAGVESPATESMLVEITEAITNLHGQIALLAKAQDLSSASPTKEMLVLRKTLVPAMETARETADVLEQMIPEDLWPLPTYSEMLLIG